MSCPATKKVYILGEDGLTAGVVLDPDRAAWLLRCDLLRDHEGPHHTVLDGTDLWFPR